MGRSVGDIVGKSPNITGDYSLIYTVCVTVYVLKLCEQYEQLTGRPEDIT